MQAEGSEVRRVDLGRKQEQEREREKEVEGKQETKKRKFTNRKGIDMYEKGQGTEVCCTVKKGMKKGGKSAQIE